MSDNEKLSAELAAALRAVADMVDDAPDLAPVIESAMNKACGYVGLKYDDKPAVLAMFARTALRHGAAVTKSADDEFSRVNATWPGLTFYAYASRDEVCERIQVGEETVTETVPDPSVLVPMVEVTKTVPVYEWQCSPLLASGGES